MAVFMKSVTLLFGAALLAALAIGRGATAEEPVLHVYNWLDYIAPDTISNFEHETGSPEVNALATLFLGVVFVLVAAAFALMARQQRRHARSL